MENLSRLNLDISPENNQVSVVGESIKLDHSVNFINLDLKKISAIHTKDNNRYSRINWKMELHRIIFNGRYNEWTLLLTKEGLGADFVIELKPSDVSSIEYVRLDVYQPKEFIPLNLSEKEWQTSIDWMRECGWENDHELLIKKQIYYIWSHRVSDSSKTHSLSQLDSLRYPIMQDTQIAKGSKFVLMAKSDVCEMLEVAGDKNTWKSWIQTTPSEYWGPGIRVHVLGPEGVDVIVPRLSSWDDREYLHHCEILFKTLILPTFDPADLKYLSEKGIYEFTRRYWMTKY